MIKYILIILGIFIGGILLFIWCCCIVASFTDKMISHLLDKDEKEDNNK